MGGHLSQSILGGLSVFVGESHCTEHTAAVGTHTRIALRKEGRRRKRKATAKEGGGAVINIILYVVNHIYAFHTRRGYSREAKGIQGKRGKRAKEKKRNEYERKE